MLPSLGSVVSIRLTLEHSRRERVVCCVCVRVYGRSKWWLGGGDVWWCVYAVGMWYVWDVMDVMWDVTLIVIVVVSTE